MTDGEQMIVDLLTRISSQLEQIVRSERLREQEQRAGENTAQLYDLSLPKPMPEWS